KLQPYINNPQGMSAKALAAARTGATDTLSNQYAQAQEALNARELVTGGKDLPSGVNSQLNASLLNSEAADKAAAQNNITLQNEQMKQTNLWNAFQTLSGNAAQLNP